MKVSRLISILKKVSPDNSVLIMSKGHYSEIGDVCFGAYTVFLGTERRVVGVCGVCHQEVFASDTNVEKDGDYWHTACIQSMQV